MLKRTSFLPVRACVFSTGVSSHLIPIAALFGRSSFSCAKFSLYEKVDTQTIHTYVPRIKHRNSFITHANFSHQCKSRSIYCPTRLRSRLTVLEMSDRDRRFLPTQWEKKKNEMISLCPRHYPYFLISKNVISLVHLANILYLYWSMRLRFWTIENFRWKYKFSWKEGQKPKRLWAIIRIEAFDKNNFPIKLRNFDSLDIKIDSVIITK